MIAIDTNLLIYAHREDSTLHRQAEAWMRERVEGAAPWAIPWPCVHEFIAVVTNRRLFRDATPMAAALAQLELWLGAPAAHALGETDGHLMALRDIAIASAISGPRIHDARVAAICLAHGVTRIATCDRDFGRFAGIEAFNPLHGERANEGAPSRRRRLRTA